MMRDKVDAILDNFDFDSCLVAMHALKRRENMKFDVVVVNL